MDTWLAQNRVLVEQADSHLTGLQVETAHVEDFAGEELRDEVLGIIRRGLYDVEGESCSVLLLGEARSGKTHLVDSCLEELLNSDKPPAVFRAFGGSYATDAECIRHLAAQGRRDVSGSSHDRSRSDLPLTRTASLDGCMDALHAAMEERFQNAGSVVFVLDKFECFCTQTRQTLLYRLFDVAQEVGVRMAIIGTSTDLQVLSKLEKRIQSRFSMRHLHTKHPTNMDELVGILSRKFRLEPGYGFKPNFRAQFNKHVEDALRRRAAAWDPHLVAGRPVMWFWARCLPISALLADAAKEGPAGSSQPPLKRQRTDSASMASFTEEEAQKILVSGLPETGHIVLLAFTRLHSRKINVVNLAILLHEIKVLHSKSGYVGDFREDAYCAAFYRLVQCRLVLLRSSGLGEEKRFWPCSSELNGFYTSCAQELDKTNAPGSVATPSLGWNPLRVLPAAVQQWALRQE